MKLFKSIFAKKESVADKETLMSGDSMFYRAPKLVESFNSENIRWTVDDCDMETLEGIDAIPVPPLDHDLYYTEQISYQLQRKATQHKKEGNMELAIACLRKSNAISDCYDPIPLLDKDYFRLPKYIEKTGDKEAAEEAWTHLKIKHPEFWDKRISNKKKIAEILAQNDERVHWPYVIVRSNSVCSVCAEYNNKLYRLEELPEIILEGGPCSEHLCSVSLVDDYFLDEHPHYRENDTI